VLAATRTLVRYRCASSVRGSSATDTAGTTTGAADEAVVIRIEGLELEKFYPPIYQGAEPPPVLVLKSRVIFRRITPGVLPAPWGLGL
jgi:hypothetical protein